jgi:hypothetical protein
MMPGKTDLNLYRGDTVRFPAKVWADAGKTQPADLTGVTAKAEIRDKAAGKLLASFACTIELPNTINLVLDAATSTILPGKGVWDLQLTYAGGDVQTVVYGSVKVTTDVTDSAAAPVGLRAVS